MALTLVPTAGAEPRRAPVPQFRRKRIRLPKGEYLGRRWYFVTVCSYQRQPLLIRPGVARSVLNRLREVSAAHSFSVHAYCVMPNHAHFLAEGTNDGSDLLEFVAAFKHRTALD